MYVSTHGILSLTSEVSVCVVILQRFRFLGDFITFDNPLLLFLLLTPKKMVKKKTHSRQPEAGGKPCHRLKSA